MDAAAFWNVIGNYNTNTMVYQLVLMILIFIATVVVFTRKNGFLIKLVLGFVNLFIGFVHFGFYGTEPIQQFFAYPLYIAIGVLFINDAFNGKNELGKITPIQYVLFSLYILYPLISFFLGNSFPKMVVYIMPCPTVTLSIVFYSIFKRKNTMLLLLLTAWGLTGVKAFIVSAYEDIILLIAGIYSLYLIVQNMRELRLATDSMS